MLVDRKNSRTSDSWRWFESFIIDVYFADLSVAWDIDRINVLCRVEVRTKRFNASLKSEFDMFFISNVDAVIFRSDYVSVERRFTRIDFDIVQTCRVRTKICSWKKRFKSFSRTYTLKKCSKICFRAQRFRLIRRIYSMKKFKNKSYDI